MRIQAMTFAIILLASGSASAQTSSVITDASIRNYYASLPDLFKKPYETFITEFNARTSDTAVITSTTTINIPGQAPTQSTSTMSKSDLIANAPQAYQSSKGANLWNQVLSITIGPDGKTARVEEISRITGMSFPGADQNRPFIADSTETCADELVLTPGIGIQMEKSDCTSIINIKQKL